MKEIKHQENLDISDASDNKSFTYEQVHKLLRDFNFQFSWIEPDEFEKWINDNVKKITETTTPVLGKYEFYCKKCNTIHEMASYCVAQITMGNEMLFTCKCGNEIELKSFN